VRMYNVKGTDQTVDMSSHFSIQSYKQTNIIEEDAKPVSPKLKVGKYAIETFSLEIKK
jgi:alpha-mannosidase